MTKAVPADQDVFFIGNHRHGKGMDDPPTASTLLLGKALVVVGVLVGIILTVVPLQGPDWPPLVLGAAIAAWGLVAWRTAVKGIRRAAAILAAGISFTGWSYYLLAPYLGVQVTGITLLLPILACLPLLGPQGVALVGLGSMLVNIVGTEVQPADVAPPPLQLASLTAATALGMVVAALHRRNVQDVAAARAHEQELALRHEVDQQRTDFLRRFINAASHEISTPLTPMILSLSAPTLSPLALERVRRSADRLHHIALGLGAVATIEAEAPRAMERLDLRPAVEQALERTGAGWPVHGEGHATASLFFLDEAIAELVENHDLYAPEAEGRIELAPGRMDVVQDPAGLKEGTRLGLPFDRHHPNSQGGLGLYALARRLERQGGHLDARVEAGKLVHGFRFPTQPS